MDSSDARAAVTTSPMTVEELATAADTTVRTIRWYTTRGLLPPPERHGRKAYYAPEHLDRLELVQALQEHGFSLADITSWLERHGPEVRAGDLVVERAMLTSWHPRSEIVPDVASLAERAGRELDDHDVAVLEATNAVARHPDGFELLPPFRVGVRLLDLDLPVDGITSASDAIRRHMVDLADELTEILRERVVAPHRASDPSPADARAFSEAMTDLRQLTLEAIVLGFQRAANEVVRDALDREPPTPSSTRSGARTA